MYKDIKKFVTNRLAEFALIPNNRKRELEKLGTYVNHRISENKKVNLIYICTHNSRRSHFGQISAAVAAAHFSIDNVQTYSGGTEYTAFNQNAIHALQKIGFIVETNEHSSNPKYRVSFSENNSCLCYSKKFDAKENPTSEFAAIMTCTDADENCPYIPGADTRIKTPYEDPKKSDGTGEENKIYTERFAEILRDNLYLFSLIK